MRYPVKHSGLGSIVVAPAIAARLNARKHNISTVVYCPIKGQKAFNGRVIGAVSNLFQSRRPAPRSNGRVVTLRTRERFIQRMIDVASHAALRRIGNRYDRLGAPPDNARIILAHDVLQACSDFGISSGLRYVHPQSFAVELYCAIAKIVWGKVQNPRRTFERLHREKIHLN
jgi:hypothetical protein